MGSWLKLRVEGVTSVVLKYGTAVPRKHCKRHCAIQAGAAACWCSPPFICWLQSHSGLRLEGHFE